MALGAVNSLIYIIKNLDNFQNISKNDVESEWVYLRNMLQRLDEECYRGIDRREINVLEARITEAAWKLEDLIESYQISQGVELNGVEQEMHSSIEIAKKLRKEYKRALRNSYVAEEDIIEENIAAAAAAADAVLQDYDNSTTVGLSDLSEEIIRGLVDEGEVKKSVFSIWGMAGIGKTHLARDIYHHPRIVQRFDLRLWVRIGPIHKDIKKIFVDILAQMKCEPMEVLEDRDEDELKHLLLKSLSEYERYLVAIDDVWSSDVLSACINAFPLWKNDSKILLTTRLLDVAKDTSYQMPLNEDRIYQKAYQMPFLSDEDSWNLLGQNVFAGKPFPTQLEKAGRKIAEICEGLPLLILTVADILRGLPRTEDCWNKIAEKKTTTFPDAYDRIYKVLVLSYDYLPQENKACFLYMGVFRQSQKIPASKLIHLYVAERFWGSDNVLEVLVSNSIVIVCKRGSSSRINSCKLHCAYWYVCVKEAREIKLFHVLNKLRDVYIEKPRRLAVQNNMLFGLKEVYDTMAASTSLTRSLLFTGEDHQYPVQICFNTMLLMKVLDALALRFYEFPNEVLNLLQLRYLTLTHNGEVPSSISKLQRLEFLILRRHHNIIKLVQRDSSIYLPMKIWNLQELRYLRIMGSNQPLPDPSNDQVCLHNLSRLYVNTDSCTEGVLKGTPNLKKLGIELKLQPEGGAETLRCLEHTRSLDRLESLKCVVVNPRLSFRVEAPPNHISNLSWSLKKLSLNGLGYPWEYISAIASLPNLKVLKLRCFAFRGPEWEINHVEFKSLEYLLLEDLDLVKWSVRGYLSNLRHLIVRHCYKLKEMWWVVSPYMETIEVDECNLSIGELAQQIKADSYDPDFKVVINYSWNL